MATEIVFGHGTSLEIEGEPADVAQALSGNKQEIRAKFAGEYLYMRTADGDDVWVNPAGVAYLKRT